MIDLSPVLSFLSSLGPWGVLIGAVAMILLQRLNIKLPNIPLPSLPKNPDMAPAPTPEPEVPGLGSGLLLKLLLSWFAAKGSGAVTPDSLNLLDVLHKEIGDAKDAMLKAK